MSRFKKQTEFGEVGNCYSACLASVFDIPLEDVPNFFVVGGKDALSWWTAVRDWLRPRGFGIMSLTFGCLDEYEGLFIVCGESTRGIEHAVLYRRGEIIFDPHPSNCGVKKITTVDMLYPLDPSKMTFSR